MTGIASNPVQGPRRGLVRTCGTVAAGIGLLALLGWNLRIPFLASFGSDVIPMAPSTAVLFVLYGVATLLRARVPLRRGAHWAGAVINSVGVLVALVLLILTFRGIHPAIEHLGFAAGGTVGGALVGHMSPLTAICFLLASLSFLGSLPSWTSQPWRVEAARWTASLLLATSCLLFTAYLFGHPPFYGGSFIPPAATTSIAFAFLGTALLALSNRQGSTTGIPERIPKRLVVFILLAASIVTLSGLYFRYDGRRYQAEVEHQLSTVAEMKTNELAQWRLERLGDGIMFADNTSFSTLVQHAFDDSRDAEARTQLQSWLTKTQTYNFYDRISVLDTQGAERLAVPEGRTAVSSAIAQRVPEVLRTRETVFEDFYRNEHDQRVYLDVLVPIFDVRNRALGMLALRIDPNTVLYPLLNSWPTSAKTAETYLVRREGNDGLFLNQLKFRKHTVLILSIPLASQKDFVAAKAVLGQEGIMGGRGYRGEPVLAAVRAVPESPWFLVARLDTAEVNEPLRERLAVTLLLMCSALALGGAGIWIFGREQRLQHLRKLYEAGQERAMLIDGVTDYAVFMLDLSGHVASWNAGAERLEGYRAEEIIGQHFSRFYPQEDVARGKPAKELEVTTREGRLEDEGWRVRKDDSRFWANVIITALRDETGRLRGFAKVMRDLTERKQAELRERLAAVVEYSEDAIISKALDGTITAWNLGAEKLFGYTSSEAMGKPMVMLCPPERANEESDILARIGRGERVDHFETIRMRKNGKPIDVSVAISPIKDSSGAIVGASTSARDITERKRAEETFHALIESAPSAMVIVNSAGQIVLLNIMAEELFGYRREELLGQSVEILIPEHLRGGHVAHRVGYIAERRSRAMGAGLALRGLRKDGTEFPLDISLSPIETEKGILVSAAILDITERKRTEEHLRQLNTELEERARALEAANQELEAFTYSVSHDLRAPLRHIDGFSKILVDDFAPHLAGEGQRVVERIRAGARNCGQLVDDLLSLSRLGRKELTLEIVGLKGVVEGVMKELEGEVQGRAIEWRVKELPFVQCDASLIKQVFANLLGNAVKFTRPRPTAVIEVGTREQEEQMVVYVRDNGVGFSMKYADKLFGVFQRLHRMEDFEGTGVGLATVQRIVHKHGGRVWAEAELDKGAMFCFTLGRGLKDTREA